MVFENRCTRIPVYIREIGTNNFYSIPCNSWKCKECAQVKKNKVFARVASNTGEDDWYFATLTLPSHCRTMDHLKQTWDKFRKLINTNHKRAGIPEQFQYFLAREYHKDGVPHLHLILKANKGVFQKMYDSLKDRKNLNQNRYQMKDQVQKLWKYSGGGIQSDFEYLDDSMKASWYAVKYAMKSVDAVLEQKYLAERDSAAILMGKQVDNNVPRQTRHRPISFSRNFPSLPKYESDKEFIVLKPREMSVLMSYLPSFTLDGKEMGGITKF